jgi:hypothetical protein
MTPLDAALAVYGAIVTLMYLMAERERKVTAERLYGAWKDGAVIPPPESAAQPEEPEDPFAGLPSEVLAWLTRWDDNPPEIKVRWANRARAILAKNRANVRETLLELDEPTW